MPGKVNPVLCEAVSQVVAQVVGNDAAVAWGGAAGNFELNVMLPVMARNVLESIRLLANVSPGLRRPLRHRHHGQRGALPRERRVGTPSIVTPLNHYIGYDEAAKIAKQAHEASARRSARSSSSAATCPTASPSRSSTRCSTCCP